VHFVHDFWPWQTEEAHSLLAEGEQSVSPLCHCVHTHRHEAQLTSFVLRVGVMQPELLFERKLGALAELQHEIAGSKDVPEETVKALCAKRNGMPPLALPWAPCVDSICSRRLFAVQSWLLRCCWTSAS
jgi:hypothetical protein